MVERFDWCAGYWQCGRSFGFVQDDRFGVGGGERSSFARYPILCKERKG